MENSHPSEEQRLGFESAFPVLDHNGIDLIMREPGLTKRELFAMVAMQGILSRGTPGQAHERAATAIEHADALLKGLAR